MIAKTNFRSTRFPGAPLMLSAALCFGAAAPAHAGLFDGLFGTTPSDPKATRVAAVTPGDSGQRLWRLGEFSRLEIVAREAGAPENQQPVTVVPEVLWQQLSLVQATTPGGRRPLFDGGELAGLVGPLAEALERAGPGEDVVLVSSARRSGSGFTIAPTALTARVFVRDGRLQLIVHDARFDFYDNWRGTNIPPRFTYGSRTDVGSVTLQSAQATAVRADWLAIPLSAPPTAGAVATPAAMPTAATMPAAVVVPVAPMAAPAVAPPPRAPLDKAGADDIERRLETLKRLRDRNLITEDEYQQKRKEILQLL